MADKRQIDFRQADEFSIAVTVEKDGAVRLCASGTDLSSPEGSAAGASALRWALAEISRLAGLKAVEASRLAGLRTLEAIEERRAVVLSRFPHMSAEAISEMLMVPVGVIIKDLTVLRKVGLIPKIGRISIPLAARRDAILKIVTENHPISIGEISRIAQLERATVQNDINYLMTARKIFKSEILIRDQKTDIAVATEVKKVKILEAIGSGSIRGRLALSDATGIAMDSLSWYLRKLKAEGRLQSGKLTHGPCRRRAHNLSSAETEAKRPGVPRLELMKELEIPTATFYRHVNVLKARGQIGKDESMGVPEELSIAGAAPFATLPKGPPATPAPPSAPPGSQNLGTTEPERSAVKDSFAAGNAQDMAERPKHNPDKGSKGKPFSGSFMGGPDPRKVLWIASKMKGGVGRL
jgi:predicted transcriptional regulator